MEPYDFRFVSVVQEHWPRLRETWLAMAAARAADDLETLHELCAVPAIEWRERARSLNDHGSLALALVDDHGQWYGFISAYLDEAAIDRSVFVTHVHAHDGDPQVESMLLDQVAQWAGEQVADAVVIGIRSDMERAIERYLALGFRRSGAVRRCDVEAGTLEIELVYDLVTSRAIRPLTAWSFSVAG